MMKLESSFHVNEEILYEINSFEEIYTVYFWHRIYIYSYYFYILSRDKIKKNSILFDAQKTFEYKETNLWRIEGDSERLISIAISHTLNLFNYIFRSVVIRIDQQIIFSSIRLESKIYNEIIVQLPDHSTDKWVGLSAFRIQSNREIRAPVGHKSHKSF